MSKGKQKESRVIINDEYCFTVDGRNMTLFRNGKLVGYYTQYEPMMRRIIRLNAIDATCKRESIHITEYLRVLQEEREKIVSIFEAMVSPSGQEKA